MWDGRVCVAKTFAFFASFFIQWNEGTHGLVIILGRAGICWLLVRAREMAELGHCLLLGYRQRRIGCHVLTAWSQSSRFCVRDTGTLALEQKRIVYQSLGHV